MSRAPNQTSDFIPNNLTVKEKIEREKIDLMRLPCGVPPEAGSHKMTDSTGRRQTVFSIVLESAAKCLPLSSLIAEFGQFAYLRRMAKQSRRIKKEIRERKAKEEPRPVGKLKKDYERKQVTLMPDWLVVCDCACCGRVIRPVQQPYWGGVNTVHPISEEVSQRIQKVPFVCGYQNDRPLCSACFRRNGW